jgi:hypothetical protein
MNRGLKLLELMDGIVRQYSDVQDPDSQRIHVILDIYKTLIILSPNLLYGTQYPVPSGFGSSERQSCKFSADRHECLVPGGSRQKITLCSFRVPHLAGTRPATVPVEADRARQNHDASAQ